MSIGLIKGFDQIWILRDSIRFLEDAYDSCFMLESLKGAFIRFCKTGLAISQALYWGLERFTSFCKMGLALYKILYNRSGQVAGVLLGFGAFYKIL